MDLQVHFEIFITRKNANDSGIHVWGMFLFYGNGPLVALEGNVDHRYYIESLEQYMLPEYEAASEIYDPIFQQDGAQPTEIQEQFNG